MKKQTIKTITEDYFKCPMRESKNIYGKNVLFCEKNNEIKQVILNDNNNVNLVFIGEEENKKLKKMFNSLKKKNKLFSEVWKNATNKQQY